MTLRSHHGEQSLKNRFWGLGGVASLSEAGLGFGETGFVGVFTEGVQRRWAHDSIREEK